MEELDELVQRIISGLADHQSSEGSGFVSATGDVDPITRAVQVVVSPVVQAVAQTQSDSGSVGQQRVSANAPTDQIGETIQRVFAERPSTTTTDLPIASSPQPAAETSDAVAEFAGNVFRPLLNGLTLAPLFSGLFKLFGGGSGADPLPELPAFALPQALHAQVGLTAQRDLVQVGYGAGDRARVVPGSSAPTEVNVVVNAMDSRSFLDRSDDIARAVREAMLNSHSINDLVADL